MTTTIHTLDAYNSARASDNPLHKDEAAKAMGYAAGLVPGVDMYAYLTYAAVQAWGEKWLNDGSATVNLLKPVYEGDACEVRVVKSEAALIGAELTCGGAIKATAGFRLGPGDASRQLAEARPMPQSRPPADDTTLATGNVLGTIRKTLSKDESPGFLRDMRDDLAIYPKQDLVHPGFLLRMCNWALSQNVSLGPWIHTESHIANHAAARLNEPLQARPRIVANYEKRGHRWVEVDVFLLGENDRPLTTVRHIAIYRPRPAAAN